MRSACPCRRGSGATGSARRTSPCSAMVGGPAPRSRPGGGSRRACARRRRRPRRPRAGPMNTWRITGSRGARGGPERRVVGGHVAPAEDRHPFLGREPRPDLLAALRGPRVPWAGRRCPRRSAPGPAGRTRARSHSSARKRCGIWIRMPAPSPVFFSQPQAPRCSRFTSTCTAWSTMAWDFRPCASTTKPMPQASCSWLGS